MKITLNYSQLVTAIERCAKNSLVPYIVSQPALGKSALVKEFAKRYNLKLIDLRLSSLEPVDVSGAISVKDNLAHYVPFDVFPIQGTVLPPEYDGVCLFLDELSSAHKQVLAAAYRLILDRQVGQYPLMDNCIIIAAGNSINHNAIATQLGTALQSRMVNLHLEVTPKNWLTEVAIPQGFDERIIAFIHTYPDMFNTFNPKLVEQTFSSPRTLEFASKLLEGVPKGEELEPITRALMLGSIGVEAGTALISFLKVYGKIPPVEEIISKPTTTEVISDSAELQWAIMSSLLMHKDLSDLPNIIKYVERYPAHMQQFFFSYLIERSDVADTQLAYDIERAHKTKMGKQLLS